jgi:hypothetical protein
MKKIYTGGMLVRKPELVKILYRIIHRREDNIQMELNLDWPKANSISCDMYLQNAAFTWKSTLTMGMGNLRVLYAKV